jgi:hypothetical protein
VSAPARSLVVFACAAGALSFTGGCGGDDPPPLNVDLLVTAAWNDEPSSVDEIGYELSVEAHLWERGSNCAPLPDLRWMVDGVEWAVGPLGACESWIDTDARPVTPGATTVVQLLSGDRVVGEATYSGLFPGAGTTSVLSPPDGRVRMGETLVVSAPAGLRSGDGRRVSVYVNWLDPAPSVPPFRSYVNGTVTADGTAVEIVAPLITGRAQVTLQSLSSNDAITTDACTGFSACRALPSTNVIGPVAIEVVP